MARGGYVEAEVYFKDENGAIYIRARGHVTSTLCPELKSIAFARLDAEPRVEKVLIDLSDCEYMDSTFLGLIVGMYKRFRNISTDRITLTGTNEICRGLLRTIGVLGLLQLSEEKPAFPIAMTRIVAGSKATARFILEAHEDLSDLSEENRSRFKTLTAVLKAAAKAPNGS
jgi:anti-anti-sigma factor